LQWVKNSTLNRARWCRSERNPTRKRQIFALRPVERERRTAWCRAAVNGKDEIHHRKGSMRHELGAAPGTLVVDCGAAAHPMLGRPDLRIVRR
jgi:hypothetical protein